MTVTTVTPPDLAVGTLLAAAGLGLVMEATPPAVGQNIFLGDARPVGPGIPANAVFLNVYGGTAPVPYFRASSHGSIWRPKVQIRVRRDAAHRPAGQELARNIAITLHCNAPSGYVSCMVMQSEPIYLGPDKAGNHEYTVNVELVRRE